MDSKDIHNKVERLLKNYEEDSRRLAVKEFDKRLALGNIDVGFEDAVISAMAFERGDGVAVSSGGISDRTAYIAAHYHQRIDALMEELCRGPAPEDWALKYERARLDYYVSLLKPRHQEALRLFHMTPGVNGVAAAKALHLSYRAAYALRSRAVSLLCKLYGYSEEKN